MKNERLTLGDLAMEEHTYWKFGQSSKGRSYERVYAPYVPGKITVAKDEDKLLSFVSEENICKCYMYGDMLTKLLFDNSDVRFSRIEECSVTYLGGGLGEYETEKLICEATYSLENLETIELLFEMVNSTSDYLILFYGTVNKNLQGCLKSYGFDKSAQLVGTLLTRFEQIGISSEVNVIKQDLRGIIQEFIEKNQCI